MDFCSYCKTKIEEDDKKCRGCGMPLGLSEEEKSRFITNIHRTNEKYHEASVAMQRAKWILFGIGFLTLIYNVYLLLNQGLDLGDFIIYGGLSLLLIIVGFLTNDYPIPSVTLGIVFVLGMFFYSVYVNPHTIFKNIIFKVLVISALIYAVKVALEFEKMIKEE